MIAPVRAEGVVKPISIEFADKFPSGLIDEWETALPQRSTEPQSDAVEFLEGVVGKWALRNAKLRFSRKLLFASGLAFCFRCQLNPPVEEAEDLFGDRPDRTARPFVKAAMRFALTPPLEYLAEFVDEFVVGDEKRKTLSRRLFDSYDKWLKMLDDEATRKALERMSHAETGRDATFKQVREIGKEFAMGLELLFFNRDRQEEKDRIAQLSIEYVGF